MMKMADPHHQSQTPLSSQEGLQELEELDLRGVAGGIGSLLKPLLKPSEKDAAKTADRTPPHPNNGTYKAPGWVQTFNGNIHLYPLSPTSR